MTDGSTFRTAQQPTEVAEVKPAPVEDVKSPVETHAPELVATYEADMGKPYVAKYFDVEGIWDSEPSLARDLKEIEGFIRQRVEKGELDNSTKSADKFLKELERKAELTRYESVPTRIAKLLAYIDFKKVVES